MDQPSESTPLWRVGILLAGCGRFDGSDASQVVALEAALDAAGAQPVPIAPDVDQHDVLCPVQATPLPPRNVLREAQRLVRQDCLTFRDLESGTLDALVIPGGLGVVKTLYGVAHSGPNAAVHEPTATMLKKLLQRGAPVGALDEGVVLLGPVSIPVHRSPPSRSRRTLRHYKRWGMKSAR